MYSGRSLPICGQRIGAYLKAKVLRTPRSMTPAPGSMASAASCPSVSRSDRQRHSMGAEHRRQTKRPLAKLPLPSASQPA